MDEYKYDVIKISRSTLNNKTILVNFRNIKEFKNIISKKPRHYC